MQATEHVRAAQRSDVVGLGRRDLLQFDDSWPRLVHQRPGVRCQWQLRRSTTRHKLHLKSSVRAFMSFRSPIRRLRFRFVCSTIQMRVKLLRRRRVLRCIVLPELSSLQRNGQSRHVRQHMHKSTGMY
jgi:hypothetical protein